jgi:hypothetical protein
VITRVLGNRTSKATFLLRQLENRMLRKVFGPKRGEVTGGWRELRNEKLHNLYTSSDIIRMIKLKRMRWVEYVARKRATRNEHNILIGRPQRKKL